MISLHFSDTDLKEILSLEGYSICSYRVKVETPLRVGSDVHEQVLELAIKEVSTLALLATPTKEGYYEMLKSDYDFLMPNYHWKTVAERLVGNRIKKIVLNSFRSS
jgi:hypothetical protein